ncbi:MAG: HesA/MoeB/ThiF family protein [Sphingobium sp.]|jgi:molybdopterin/thiamine biosynthesis adenylyltransferase|nr:HesA/MoeB/ThiF family protein [Sphingobium sp.]MCI1757234.1 HesA/MoeB/ThiF family protein [Sphingobium sp.]MCI2052750.1 HesA/MoeB/ThiF family protein [Sphingobium sp.]
MSLDDALLDRYARHIVLREIGGAGQMQLMSAHVTVVGAGGIGCPAIQYLAGAGVGTIRVIDDDAVALSNLQRQTLFGSEDIGRSKAEAAMQAVARLNPHVKLIPIVQRLDADNAETLLRHSDVIIDGCDNFSTRLIVSDVATRLRIPLVSSAVGQFEGQLSVFRGWEAGKPCYRCLVGEDPARAEASCAEQGVLGALTGVMGSLAALEAIRAIVPFGEDSAGKLLIADLLNLRFRTISLPADPACTACAAAREPCPA